MVLGRCHADRALPLVLAMQSVKRETLAKTLQTLLQPPPTESTARWLDSYRGGAELDSSHLNFFIIF